MWGLDELDANSLGFQGVNPTYVTTARPGGIFLRYRLSKTAMTSFRTLLTVVHVNTYERYKSLICR